MNEIQKKERKKKFKYQQRANSLGKKKINKGDKPLARLTKEKREREGEREDTNYH